MPLLIQYNGENGQVIKLSVTPNVAKSTYYRIIQYGIDVFPKYIKNYSLVKKRNEIIINLYGKVLSINPQDEVTTPKVKIIREPQVKPKTNNELIEKIINFLNESTGKSFKTNSKRKT
jgi:ArsR family metal-binding transcriptional regulator